MLEKEKNFISAVIYVHNCAGEIRRFMETVESAIDTYFEHGEIICVDDASTDESISIIREVASAYPQISTTILHLDSFHGMEAAMQGGVGLSIGDFVFEFDHPYAMASGDDLMKVYRTSTEGADIVAAVSSENKRASSGLFYKIFNRFADISYPIGSECFRILSRRAINRTYSQSNVIAYRKVAYATSGLKALTVNIEHGPKLQASKEGRRARRALATDSLLLFTNVGFNISLILTCIMMGVLIIFAIYALITRILGLPVEGWTSMVLLIAFGFFGIFMILTLITKYLQLLVRMGVRKKAFTYESIEKIS
ncbi:MAG: glycosyltransferase [Lachnospiraceae bacterium]|nr:glycosyltransferase [Lachnospiraceae bacterium]